MPLASSQPAGRGVPRCLGTRGARGHLLWVALTLEPHRSPTGPAVMETCPLCGVGKPPSRHPIGFGEGYGRERPHGAGWERNFVGTHHLLGINLQSLGKRPVPAAGSA